MKVSSAALPTVRRKCAAIHAVLCTTELSTYAALIDPPNPPPMKRTPASSTDATVGLPQGRAPIQPKRPFPPRSRPATSSEATTVNAARRLGQEIAIVLKV